MRERPDTAAEADLVERELQIAAPPETVWAFWVDPSRLVRWMGRTATLDARPGGMFRVDYGGDQVMRGEYLELDEPRRLVFSWGWEAPDEAVRPGTSRVEVDLEPDGAGTRLRLRHRFLPAAEQASHAEGWDYFLPRLVEALTA